MEAKVPDIHYIETIYIQFFSVHLRWFDLTEDSEVGVTYYKFNHKYWKAKLVDDYSECPEIY